MDWSLVLISQGIESIISRSAPDLDWGLQVSSEDYEAALEAIRLYQTENRGWGLRREILQPGLLFDWLSLSWVVLLCAFYFLNDTWTDLKTPGVLDTVAVTHGQWWRLFTAIWLHADLAHLASNLMFGFVLLGLAMGRYGPGVSLVAAYLAGVGGNICSWVLASQPKYGLGASGMVMGCLGLLAVPTVSLWRKTPQSSQSLVVCLCGAVMLFALLGLTPGTDVVAHLGGFGTGVLIAWVLTRYSRTLRRPLPNLISALSFLLLVLWPWWLSLYSRR